MLDLSVVVPTLNRAALLRECVRGIHAGTSCRYEVVVVDGASTDATPGILDEARDLLGDGLRVIREPCREGFVKAANRGFRAAAGRNIMWLNDDARPLAGSLDAAVDQLDFAPARVGVLALFHRTDTPRNIAYQTVHAGRPFGILHVRGTLYANFGLARRETFHRLRYFDERYFLNGADPDFSLKAWHAGLRVMPAVGALIDHDEHEDDRRHTDRSAAQDDNRKLFAKWRLPPRNPTINDFDPLNPCTLRGLNPEAAETVHEAA